MKSMRVIGLCLAAVLVIGATATASASATSPLFYSCQKVPVKKGTKGGGGFTNSACTKPSPEKTGKYEGYQGVEKPEFSLTGGATTFEAVGGTKVTCKTASGTGTFGGTSHLTTLELEFTGCESGGHQCTTPEVKEGELATNLLKGALGWTSEANQQVALELFQGESTPMLEAQCGESQIKVQGSLLVPIKAGKVSDKTPLKFAASKGIQKPEAFEGGKTRTLQMSVNGKAFERAGLTLGATMISQINIGVGPCTACVSIIPGIFGTKGTVTYSNQLVKDDAECCGGGFFGGGPQEFFFANGVVTCQKTVGTPNVSALPGVELGVEVKNEQCTFNAYESTPFGNSPYPAEQVGSTEYLYYATGEFVLNNALTFHMPSMGPPSGGGCTVEIGVSPQHETELYLAKHGNCLSAEARAEHLVYERKGGNCYAWNKAFPNPLELAVLRDGFEGLEWSGT